MSDWLIENSLDGTVLAYVPSGEFLAGEPAVRVSIPACYLAVTPVTNAQYLRFVHATGHRHPLQADRGRPGWDKDGFPPELAERPVVCVNWFDACTYCEWAVLRLPRELEWEKGARGTDGRRYPWGNDWVDGRHCGHGVDDDTDGQVAVYSIWQHREGISPYGLWNMLGNVAEWCSDWWDRSAPQRWADGDTAQPGTGYTKVLRGGSWDSLGEAKLRCSVRDVNVPSACTDFQGFRCAADSAVEGAAPPDWDSIVRCLSSNSQPMRRAAAGLLGLLALPGGFWAFHEEVLLAEGLSGEDMLRLVDDLRPMFPYPAPASADSWRQLLARVGSDPAYARGIAAFGQAVRDRATLGRPVLDMNAQSLLRPADGTPSADTSTLVRASQPPPPKPRTKRAWLDRLRGR